MYRGKRMNSFNNGSGTNKTKANLTINVTRNSADIAAELPFAIFAASEFEQSYRRLIGPVLPAGVTLVSVALDANSTNMVFTFNDGVNTDTITVSCTAAPYSFVLDSSKFDLIHFQSLKFGVNNAANLNQKTLGIEYVSTSIFGNVSKDTFTPDDYTQPSDQIETQVYVPLEGLLDKTSGFVSSMIDTASARATYVFYVDRYAKYDATILSLGGIR